MQDERMILTYHICDFEVSWEEQWYSFRTHEKNLTILIVFCLTDFSFRTLVKFDDISLLFALFSSPKGTLSLIVLWSMHTTCIQCSPRILAAICFALFRIVDILVKFYSTTTPISEFKRTDYMGTIGLSVVQVNKQELNFQNDEILQCIPYLHHDK